MGKWKEGQKPAEIPLYLYLQVVLGNLLTGNQNKHFLKFMNDTNSNNVKRILNASRRVRIVKPKDTLKNVSGWMKNSMNWKLLT